MTEESNRRVGEGGRREGKKKKVEIVKQMKRERANIVQAKFVKDEGRTIMVEREKILERE